MSSRWLPVSLALSVVVGLVVAAPTVFARSIETPSYTVEAEQAGFEVRRYAPRLVAEVTVEGEPSDATNLGFRILADFIFGNNTGKAEIAMTAPVDRTSQTIDMTAPVDRTAVEDQGDKWVVAFTMPSKYTLDTLPEPNDARIRIREVPGKTYAVIRFSGSPSEAVVQRRMLEFASAVAAAGLTPSGAAPTYARYDPPWTLGFMRRNEILVELADSAE